MRSPYPEVTDVILPSSLTRVLPITLVYSTRPPVLVCGTVKNNSRNEDFLVRLGHFTHSLSRESIRDNASALTTDLPIVVST